MKTIFRNVIAFSALIAIVYFVTNYSGTVQETVGVKGVSTQKAHEITTNITNDINNEINNSAEKIGEIKISDIVNGLSRFQKIPQDIEAVKIYVTEQINTITHKEKK